MTAPMVSVPVEPTKAMRAHGRECPARIKLVDDVVERGGWPYDCGEADELVAAIYRAMIAAAPAPQPVQVEAVAWVCTRRLTGDKRAFDEPFIALNPAYVKAHPDHDWKPLYTQPPAPAVGGGKPAQTKSEVMIRWLLAREYSGANLYCDDGEMQDNSAYPFIDFLRDDWTAIELKLRERLFARQADPTPTVQIAADVEQALEDLRESSIPSRSYDFIEAALRSQGQADAVDAATIERAAWAYDNATMGPLPSHREALIAALDAAWPGMVADAEAAKVHLAEARDLLAIIHGDGGHYTDGHGFMLSCVDASTVVTQLRADADSLIARIRELERIEAEWRPIEEAPKDGTFVLLTDTRHPPCHLIGRFKHNSWWGQQTQTGRAIVWREATHWMPLPAPPADGEK